MNTASLHSMGREFAISLAIHICIFGAVVVFGHTLDKPRETVLVYLTDELPGAGRGGSARAAALSKEDAKPQGKPATTPESAKKRPERSLSTTKALSRNVEKNTKDEERKTPAEVDRSEAGVDAASISNGLPQRTGGGEGGRGSGGGAGSGPGAGTGVGSGYGQSFGSGRGGAASNLKMQYLKEHFGYIRDLIMKHINYPHMARKMGWRGRVVVAFIIRENGTVENTRVVKSSGYDVLDSNTVKTIREAQPFPRPPVKAELVIPIVYKLE
ncbi:MAG: energy transducer TonB [Syntrophorhabdaceae bacterium]|nr:energy transducer TonB [Syntrophorhabdaceae bacterium]